MNQFYYRSARVEIGIDALCNAVFFPNEIDFILIGDENMIEK